MKSRSADQNSEPVRSNAIPRVLVATTAMLTFVSFWRAAIVLNDLASVRLAVVAANDLWDAILRAAVNLQSSTIVLGHPSRWTTAEQSRQVGLAWERLPDPRLQLNLEIFEPGGERQFCVLGPHVPHLTANEVKLVHQLWLRFSEALAPEEVHHVVHFALNQVVQELDEGKETQVIERLRGRIEQNKKRRSSGF